MGGFYGSVHVRGVAYDKVKQVLEEEAKNERCKFYLGPAIGDWVSFYPDSFGQAPIGTKRAKAIGRDVLQMMIHDDDIFCYWYWRDGKLRDEYDSCPDYFGQRVSAKKRTRLSGKPEVFSDVVDDPGKVESIREILECARTARERVGEIPLPKKLTEQMKELESIANEMESFASDPGAVEKFISENPELLDDELKSLAEDAASKGTTSKEDLTKLMKDPGQMQAMMAKVMQRFMQSRGWLDKTGKWSEDSGPQRGEGQGRADELSEAATENMFMGEDGQIRPPAGLLASESMMRFAEVLGITNAVTSYEYLGEGETDDMQRADEFVRIG
ncbi:MAG: hypothetical protein ACYSUP_09675 [Planctomycetota bacterium]|jgi:hypothetical protein